MQIPVTSFGKTNCPDSGMAFVSSVLTKVASDSCIFLGIKGHVVCIRRTDGQELWRTRLGRNSITTVLVEENKIYAASRGHLYSLHRDTGKIIWENRLPGLGYGMCSFGASSSSSVAAFQAAQAAQAAMIVAASAGGAAAASSGA